DGQLARWELEHFLEHGIETRHGRRLAADERAGLLAALAPLAEPFEQRAPVLVHRDFMAWNLHVQDGRLRLLDFQDALLGPDAYDLAALLTDRTTGTLVPTDLEGEPNAHLTPPPCAAAVPRAHPRLPARRRHPGRRAEPPSPGAAHRGAPGRRRALRAPGPLLVGEPDPRYGGRHQAGRAAPRRRAVRGAERGQPARAPAGGGHVASARTGR